MNKPYMIKDSIINLSVVKEAWVGDYSTPRFLWHNPTTKFCLVLDRTDQEMPDYYSFSTHKEAREELERLLEELVYYSTEKIAGTSIGEKTE